MNSRTVIGVQARTHALATLGPIVTIVEQATVTSGTGRFADTTGSFTIRRTFDPATGRTTGSFEGTLQLAGH